MIKDILDEIAATSGNKAKVDALTKHKNNDARGC